MNIFELQRKLDEVGVPRKLYILGDLPLPYGYTEPSVLERMNVEGKDLWVYYTIDERGGKHDFHYFDNDSSASQYMFNEVYSRWKSFLTENNDSVVSSSVNYLLQDIHKAVIEGKDYIYRYDNRSIPFIKNTQILDSLVITLLELNGDKTFSIIKNKNTDEKYYELTFDGGKITLDEMNGKWLIHATLNDVTWYIQEINYKYKGKWTFLEELDNEADACTVFYYYLRKKY